MHRLSANMAAPPRCSEAAQLCRGAYAALVGGVGGGAAVCALACGGTPSLIESLLLITVASNVTVLPMHVSSSSPSALSSARWLVTLTGSHFCVCSKCRIGIFTLPLPGR